MDECPEPAIAGKVTSLAADVPRAASPVSDAEADGPQGRGYKPGFNGRNNQFYSSSSLRF